MEVIIQMINTVGFPIFCCIVMFVQNQKLQETLSNVNVTMASLVEKIETMESRLNKEEK